MSDLYNIDILKKYLSYCPSGNMIWNVTANRKNAKVGDVAGCLNKGDGYIYIGFNNKLYPLHRIVYVYHFGYIAEGFVIDHINGDITNNKIENLQCISIKNNTRKQKIRQNNKSGYRGVYFNKKRNKWHSKIMVDNRQKCLGFFDDLDAAAIAYNEAAKIYYGEYAVFNVIKNDSYDMYSTENMSHDQFERDAD